MTGRTGTNSFPTVNPLQGSHAGNGDAFLMRLRFDVEPFCTCTSGAPCGNTDAGAGCVNSTGSGGLLRASGSTGVAADDLFLTASRLPTTTSGLVFMGPQSTSALLLGNGLRCVGGGTSGVMRFPVQSASPAGTFAQGPIVGHTHANFPTRR